MTSHDPRLDIGRAALIAQLDDREAFIQAFQFRIRGEMRKLAAENDQLRAENEALRVKLDSP